MEVGLQSVLVITPGGASPRAYNERDVFCVRGRGLSLVSPCPGEQANLGRKPGETGTRA